MHGNVAEWVEDCYHGSYRDAPADGSAWTAHCAGMTDFRVQRGGAWQDPTNTTRSAARAFVAPDYHDSRIGFRIARTE
jgi:formylglycine-generating enzyme required for sulfatase activity